MGQNALIELKVEAVCDRLDDATKAAVDVDEAFQGKKAKIFGREAPEHERRAIDLKFEYGFKERSRIKKFKGGKPVREKKERKLVKAEKKTGAPPKEKP